MRKDVSYLNVNMGKGARNLNILDCINDELFKNYSGLGIDSFVDGEMVK